MSLGAILGSRFALMVTGRVALLALSFVVLGLLTRTLGPEDFGHYRTAVAYLTLLCFIADFGLRSIFVREISREDADQVRITGNAITLRLAVTLVAIGAGVALATMLGFDGPAFFGILAGAAGYVAYSLHLMLFGLFQQKLRQQGVVISEIVGGVALVAMVVMLIRAGAGPVWFVAALSASYGFTLMLTLFFAHRLIPLRPALDLASWRKMFWFALPLAAVESMAEIYFRADSVLIALLHSPEMVGLYGVPAKVMDGTLGVTSLLVGLFAPLFARSAITHPAEFSRYLEQALNVLVMGSIAAALVLFILADEIVVLIAGAAFADSADILPVLSLVIVSHSANYLMREAAVALNIQQRLIPVYFAGTVTAFVCYIPLIARYGGVGAAASILIAELLMFTLLYRMLCGTRAHSVSLRVPVLACLCGAMSVGTTASMGLWDGPWWIRCGAVLGLYAALLVATRALSLKELGVFCRDMLSQR
jgi:O-antigen/teichoic acid export membrane protein